MTIPESILPLGKLYGQEVYDLLDNKKDLSTFEKDHNDSLVTLAKRLDILDMGLDISLRDLREDLQTYIYLMTHLHTAVSMASSLRELNIMMETIIQVIKLRRQQLEKG
jgi:hypothetical protein